MGNINTKTKKVSRNSWREDWNHFEGPDFKEAELIIQQQKWHGQIEIHCKSSDWYAHNHQNDPNYANVLLHVVYLHDKEVYHKDGTKIPVIELRNTLDQSTLNKYQPLMLNSLSIPCEKLIKDVNPVYLNLQLQQAAIERLNNKSLIWLNDL